MNTKTVACIISYIYLNNSFHLTHPEQTHLPVPLPLKPAHICNANPKWKHMFLPHLHQNVYKQTNKQISKKTLFNGFVPWQTYVYTVRSGLKDSIYPLESSPPLLCPSCLPCPLPIVAISCVITVLLCWDTLSLTGVICVIVGLELFTGDLWVPQCSIAFRFVTVLMCLYNSEKRFVKYSPAIHIGIMCAASVGQMKESAIGAQAY